MSKNIQLLIIDPQNDFCQPDGALSVPGGLEDMLRVATMIDRMGNKFEDIHITYDSHHQMHIAHGLFWRNSADQHPNPFTIITQEMVENGEWFPVHEIFRRRAKDYVRQLKENGRYALCIWPPHCLIGSYGHNVVPELQKSLMDWERRNLAMINKVSKGSNLYTEHYSAVKADVVDPSDPTTQMNNGLVQTLEEADEILLCGEALSHCLKFTVEDIADNFADESYVKKMVLLKDVASSVGGFEQQGDDFVKAMVVRGMRTTTTVDYMA